MKLKDFLANLITGDCSSWDKEEAEKAKWFEVRLFNTESDDYEDYVSAESVGLLLKGIDSDYLGYEVWDTDSLIDSEGIIFVINILLPNRKDNARDDWRDERLPYGYCEIEYADMESEEAVRGCAFDDMNYLRYMER